MPKTDDGLAPAIRHYFFVKDLKKHPKGWLIECPHCGQEWRLVRRADNAPVAVGNILHLLNHERSHHPEDE